MSTRYLALLLIPMACAESGSRPADTAGAATAAAPAAEWQNLVDSAASGWRSYKKAGLEGWQVVDGALTRTGPGGDIVYAAQEFGDFELELEWKLQPKGNSGVFFRGTEATEWLYENAPEMQILDNVGHPDNATDLTVAGSNYGLHPAPREAVKPVGEWNTARIVVQGAHVEHWLNGQKIVDYELWSPDWEAKVKASKFNQWPSYGRATKGFIGLQDHGDWVAYRNVRIRPR
jgi:Domain of Unknown Function (DUF1080)